MTLPTKIIARIVPIPILKNNRFVRKPISNVIPTQQKSTIFFVVPISLPIFWAIAFTMPSPGFGTISIFTVNAAPTPVQMIARNKINNCDGSV